MGDLLVEWRRFVGDMSPVQAAPQPSTSLRPLILESWRRSRSADVDPRAQGMVLRQVDQKEIQHRVSANAELIEVARPHLEWLSRAHSEVMHVSYLVDRDGIVLASTGNDPETMRVAGLLPGYDWSEAAMGTNGGGTALVAGEPVAVEGAEHFAQVLHGYTCTGAPVRGPSGDIIGAIDVSSPAQEGARKRLPVVAHAAHAIERELELRHELRGVRAAAEETKRDKSDFIRIMSQELRTPLTAIAGYVDLLDMEIAGRLTSEQRDELSRIKRNSQHLVTLIENVVTFTQVEEGRFSLELVDVSVDTLLTDIEARVRAQVRAKRLVFELTRCDASVVARADAGRLRQILLNLVENSIKFTDARGRIVLACEAQAQVVLVRLTDTGRGIPPDKLEAIFEPFSHIDRYLMPVRHQGAGLSLAISRRLARAMGGEITVESSMGHGSTFTLTVPRS